MKTKLSVNVNKLATLRNARGKNNPDLAEASRKILQWGAHGITVHPRPDERHIRFEDVRVLSAIVREFNQEHNTKREFNIEGYPHTEFLKLIAEVQPDQATLVPDPPDALTSNAGWKMVQNQKFLHSVIDELHKSRCRVSIFIDPFDLSEVDEKAILATGADRIELYTEAYAEHFGTSQQKLTLERYRICAEKMVKLGLGVNAGHDLTQANLKGLIQEIPSIQEVSIGHALICEALYDGMESTIKNYLKVLNWH